MGLFGELIFEIEDVALAYLRARVAEMDAEYDDVYPEDDEVCYG